MFAHRRFACLALLSFLVATPALAGPPPADLQRSLGDAVIHGGPAGSGAKAARDTFLLMGPHNSGAPYVGDFEYTGKSLDPTDPSVHGWTSRDYTAVEDTRWHVSDYFAVNGSYSAWCGDPDLPSCDGGLADPDGGYGPNWNELLEFRGTVGDNTVSTTLNITAVANIYSEPGYDGTTLQAEKFDLGFVDIAYWEGVSNGLPISELVTYVPGEYMGAAADEVVLVWRFESDGGWDDSDCSFPSSGGIQLDDVLITSDNGAGTGGVVDFEDQTFGPLAPRLPQGVGDFAKIWSGLNALDPCVANYSRQVAFIDDGLVVPGTGGSPCQDWCYGPQGFIVNTTGGLAGPTSHLHSMVESPVMDWPDPSHAGALFTFTVWRHEDLSADAPGMFYMWHVRSSNTGDPADIENAGWQDRAFVYYGGPNYQRSSNVVSDLMVPGATHVQVTLGVYEVGWVWGWQGNDGYPAPYFDNVRFQTYSAVGPGMATREISLANDAFPANGTIDMADPGALSVRFDMAQDISPPSHNNPTFGDSLVFDCVVTAPDAVLEGLPRMVYKVRKNPVFDPWRTSPLPYEGEVDCEQVTSVSGLPVPNRYFGDLDDEGFLFPGDIVHYLIRATQRDTLTDDLEISYLPPDTTGFGRVDDSMGYNPSFRVQCLPTIKDLAGAQSPILFWNDFGNRGGRDEWYRAFWDLGMVQGVHFDTYYTNGPSSGVGNGLGGAATPLQLADYEVMLYTAGDLNPNTISNGDLNNDSGPDLQTVTAWLDMGDKGAYLTSDNLASSLDGSGLEGSIFVSDMMNVVVNSSSIIDLIGGQLTPRILPTDDETVFNTVGSWIAYGSCPGISHFDAVQTINLGTRIAVFADASGNDGGYPYSACTIASGVGVALTSEVISMPYDFASIHTDPDEIVPVKVAARTAARTRILNDVLIRFGFLPHGGSSGTGLPVAVRFTASHHPNPFNPLVNLSFTIARPGRLTVKVYDVRGRLVRTLFDEQVATTADLVWNGKDDQGADTASGVYFYEARMHGDAKIGKVTLIR